MRGESRHVPSRPRPAGRTDGGADSAADTARLTRVLEPVVQTAGLDLESVRVAARGPAAPAPDRGGRRRRPGPGRHRRSSAARCPRSSTARGSWARPRTRWRSARPGWTGRSRRSATGAGRGPAGARPAGARSAGLPGHGRGPGPDGPAGRGGPGDRRPAAGVRLSGNWDPARCRSSSAAGAQRTTGPGDEGEPDGH